MPTGQMTGTSKLIGQAFLEAGLLTEEQLNYLLTAQVKLNQRLGEAAVAAGLISQEALAQFLAKFFQLPYLDLNTAELDPAAVGLVPEPLASRHTIIPVKKEKDQLTIAMADPLDIRAVDAVRLQTHHRVVKVVSSRGAILKAIERSYHGASNIAQSMDHLLEGQVTSAQRGEVQVEQDETILQMEQLRFEASDAPVVQFVNLLLMRAVQERASDIHIEPEEQGMVVRLRVDGQLREVSAPPAHMQRAIITRIKLMGNLDIAERRLPQDGRFKVQVFDKTIDIRLSSLPTSYGEKLVLRILDRGTLIFDMEKLGFESKMLEVFNKVLHLPHGLLILTGPTGSGKTTTLYAALSSIQTPTKNIVTVEDPVEYQLRKINQVHVKPAIGLTFAAGLRSILRQDPDIIMVGEIRDKETADICIRAALTGHLVLSTLHTNDAVSAISRLVDIGIEPYLITAALNLVMAQRLVRRICLECADKWQPPEELLERLRAVAGEDTPWKFLKGKGCKRCGETGYFGRVSVYEQFLLTEKVKALISRGAALQEVHHLAQQEGLQTLLQSALNKVRDGITTLDEALSICGTQTEMGE